MKRRAFLGLLSATTASVVAPSASANASIIQSVSVGAAPAQSSDEVVRFIVFGDSGKGDTAQHELARMMVAHHWNQFYDMALMLGDNIYPDGNPEDIPAKLERP